VPALPSAAFAVGTLTAIEPGLTSISSKRVAKYNCNYLLYFQENVSIAIAAIASSAAIAAA
jgi:hypothetical protein